MRMAIDQRLDWTGFESVEMILLLDNVTYYDKVSLRMSFIGYQAPNVGHIL